MASHYTHALCALDAWNHAFGSPPTGSDRSWLIQGAQGTDPFFHSVRTVPKGQEWGYRTHAGGYGRLTLEFLRSVGSPIDADLRAFLLGFISHPVLDRHVHPWVNWASGWADPGRPDTADMDFCHPYLERIVDMVMLGRRGLDRIGFNYSGSVPTVDERIALTAGPMAAALRKAYPDEAAAKDVEGQVRSAIRDDGEFLAMLSLEGPVVKPRALEAEKRGELPRRVLGFFFPDRIPPGDWINEEGRPWRDPRRGGESRHESFADLFERAVSDAAGLMRLTSDAIEGLVPLEKIGDAVGNGDLSDASPEGEELPFLHCDPLPVLPLIEAEYTRLG